MVTHIGEGLSSRRFLAHRHGSHAYDTRSIWSSQNRRLLPQAVKAERFPVSSCDRGHGTVADIRRLRCHRLAERVTRKRLDDEHIGEFRRACSRNPKIDPPTTIPRRCFAAPT